LKRYEGKKFGGRNWNFGKHVGYIWNYRMLEGLLCKKIGIQLEFLVELRGKMQNGG
jgi:hypothetical protein